MRTALAVVGLILAALLAFVLGFGGPMLTVVGTANSAEYGSPLSGRQEAFSLRRSVPTPAPEAQCSAATLSFDLVDDEAEVTVASADVFDEPGGEVVRQETIGAQGVVLDGPECADLDGEGQQFWEVDFSGGAAWVLDSQIAFFIQPPEEGGSPANDFDPTDSVWRVIGSANGNVRETPGGTLICAIEAQVAGTVQANDFGSCDAVDGDGDACREALGGVTNIWWYKVAFPVTASCPSGATGWIGDDQLEAAAAPPTNSFSTGDDARKDDDGTSTDLFATAAGSDIGDLASGQYCTITGAAVFATAAYYWPVNCPNIGNGFALDSKLEPTDAPPFGPFSLGVTVDHASGPVRETPAGTNLGTLGNVQATITGGPRYADGVSGAHNDWWQEIDSPTLDGWVGVNRLTLASPPPDPPPGGDPSITPPTADTVVNITGGISGGSLITSSLERCIALAPTGTEASRHVTDCILPAGTKTYGSSVTMTCDVGKEIVVKNPSGALWTPTSAVGITIRNGGDSDGFETTQTVTSFTHVSGKLRLTLGSVPGTWKAGDKIKFFSLNDPLPNARLQSTGANNRRMGELMEIESVTATTVTFTEPLSTPTSFWTNSSSTLRAAKMAAGCKLWLMDTQITGNVDFQASQLTLLRLSEPRIIEHRARQNGFPFILLRSTWRALVYEPDIGVGRAESSQNFLARGVEDIATKHTLIECTGTKVNGFDHRHFTDTDPPSTAGSSDPTSYGPDYFQTTNKCVVHDMRSSYFSTHEGSWGPRYTDIVAKDNGTKDSNYCMTNRSQGPASIDGFVCDTGRGIQDGITQFDGRAGDLDCRNCTITTNSERWSVNAAATIPGAVKRIIDSTCNGTVSSAVQKINSPGC